MYYGTLIVDCINAGPICTPRLQQELIQVSFQTLYTRYEMDKCTISFWSLVSRIVEMLHRQVSCLCNKSVKRAKVLTISGGDPLRSLRCYMNKWAVFIYVVEKQLPNQYQKLEEQFPRLISELSTVCIQAFIKPDIDEWLTWLLYDAHYSHLLPVHALNPAFAFFFGSFPEDIKPSIRQIIKRIVTLHAKQQSLEFTRQHYTTVTHFLIRYYGLLFYCKR